VIAVAVLVGLATASPPQVPQRQPAGTWDRIAERPWGFAAREQELTALLHRRAEAIRSRDESAFLASVDPKAPAGFRESQRALFRNLAGVPLMEWSYRLDPRDTVAPPSLPQPAEETWAPRVTLNYTLAGVDTVPTRRSTGYLFARRGGTWYIAGDDLRMQGRRHWRGPWDFAACRTITTESGLIIGHDGNQELMARVAQDLDAAIAAVTEVWGPFWPRRVGVLVPASRDELQAMVGPEFAVDGIAAVAVADRVDTVARRVEGPRIVLNPQTAGQLSPGALRVVLQHEITHVAARADTVDGAPMWMLEGFADYVGFRNSALAPAEIAPDLLRQLRQEGPPAFLPSDREFHMAGRRLDLAYQQAWSLVDFLVKRLGEPRVVQLYRRIAASSSPATVDTALREVTGMAASELLAAWSEELHRTLG
jgi:hypothetical protein